MTREASNDNTKANPSVIKKRWPKAAFQNDKRCNGTQEKQSMLNTKPNPSVIKKKLAEGHLLKRQEM